LVKVLKISSKGVGGKFFGRGRWQKEQQDRVIAPICLPLFYQWRVRWCTGHAPELTSRERCTKSPT